MAATPSFANTPRNSTASVVTANTARDGTGTVATLFTAGASGSLVTYIRLEGGGTTTANMLRLFMFNGSNYFLLQEFQVTAITPSTTVAVYQLDYIPPVPIVIPSGSSLRMTTNNGEQYYATAYGYDY